MVLVKRPEVKKLSIHRRHLGLRAIDQVHIKYLTVRCGYILQILRLCKSLVVSNKRFLWTLFFYYFVKLKSICMVDEDQLWFTLPVVPKVDTTIESFTDSEIRQYFRFNSQSQLKRIYIGFRFPPKFHSSQGHVFRGQKVFLVGIYRLRYPNLLNDYTWITLFGLRPQQVSMCFKLFTEFILHHWGYLIFDHFNYWLPHLPYFAEKIRLKANSLGCQFLPASHVNGFNIFGFIDNTTIETCRPGGGPAASGTNAPRHDYLIQRAFYNGWKKHHGIKFQSVILPNGMDFNIYGPVSLRHSDLYTLGESNINAIISNLQAGNNLQYSIYGDSAYMLINDSHLRCKHSYDGLTPLHQIENSSMSSCREAIEWNFGSAKTLWAYLQYAPGLKLRKSAIGDAFSVAAILRNAHNCFNGSNTCKHFNCIPPSFEDWIREGPRM